MANFTYDLLLIIVVVFCMLADFRGGVLRATVRLGTLAVAIWSLPALVPAIASQLTVLGTLAGITTTVLILAVFHFFGNQFANLLHGRNAVIEQAHNSLLSLLLGFTRGNIYGVLLILTTAVMPTAHGTAFWREGFLAPYYRGFVQTVANNGWFPHTGQAWVARLDFTPDQQLVLYSDPTLPTPATSDEQTETANSNIKKPNEVVEMIRGRKLTETIDDILTAEDDHYQYTQSQRAEQENTKPRRKNRRADDADDADESTDTAKSKEQQELTEAFQILCALNENCRLDIPAGASDQQLRELITEVRAQLEIK